VVVGQLFTKFDGQCANEMYQNPVLDRVPEQGILDFGNIRMSLYNTA